tara:strand:- start:185 stop:562 length:378 start_codon:yes stop_codon:yes gene_type:complete
MMKYLPLILALLLPGQSWADIDLFRLKALLEICETAKLSSDPGTVNSIASQLQNAERPSNTLLAKKYDECLFTAFGKNKKIINISNLITQISKTADQLEKECRDLLAVAPPVAVANPICKDILLR